MRKHVALVARLIAVMAMTVSVLAGSPALAASPASPNPVNGATGVSLKPVLRWNTQDTTTTVKVLAFTGFGVNSGLDSDYQRMFAAIRTGFNDFKVYETKQANPSLLAQELIGKQVFIIPPQDYSYWTGDVGASIGDVLKKFVSDGGLVIICDRYCYYSAVFLRAAGLMDAYDDSYDYDAEAKVKVANTITEGVAASFYMPDTIEPFESVGDAQVLVGGPDDTILVASKTIRFGTVLAITWDYSETCEPMNRILQNALRSATNPVANGTFDVYFGTANPPATKTAANTSFLQFNPDKLDYGTNYYWRVVAHSTTGDTTGTVWAFRTLELPPPAAASNPQPANQATFVPVASSLTWEPGEVPATFDVRLDTKNPPQTQVVTGLTKSSFTPPALTNDKVYYWQVISRNSAGTTNGPVWRFSTPSVPATPHAPTPTDKATSVPLSTVLQWNEPAKPIQILAYKRYVYTREYQNTIKAITDNYSNVEVTDTDTDSSATLAAQLVGKHVFLFLNQGQNDYWGVGEFGTRVGPVLKRFVQNGGLAVVINRELDIAAFMQNAGLMTMSGYEYEYDAEHKVNISNDITKGVASTFSIPNSKGYKNVGTAQVLVKSVDSGNAVVASKPLGLGTVLFVGWEFSDYNKNMALVLANAVRYWGGNAMGLEKYDVYFGTANPPTTKIASGTLNNQVSPGTLDWGKTYYWKVVAHNYLGDKTGPVWSFQALKLPMPAVPASPAPRNQSTFIPLTPLLSWSEAKIPTTFSVKLGTTNPPTTEVAKGLTAANFTPSTSLNKNTTYYWQVKASNATGSVSGPVWKFSTVRPPLAPRSPYPPTKAGMVLPRTTLRWNLDTGTQPVKVLAFVGHCNKAADSPYQYMLNAVREHFTDFEITETTAESSSTLAAQLVGKQVFLMPAQDGWSASGLGAFGTNVGPVLKQFAQYGGLVAICDGEPYGSAQFMTNAGFFTATYYSNGYNFGATMAYSNSITEGLPSTFTTSNETVTYSTTGEAKVLIKRTTSGKPIVSSKSYGAGTALLLGWNYQNYSEPMGRLLANAIKSKGGAAMGLETYDVYFGTSNPPTTKVSSAIFENQFSTGTLKFKKNYYWQVIAHNAYGDTAGPVWSFTTSMNAVRSSDWLKYE